MMEYARAARMLGASARVYTGELAPLVRDLAEALFDVALILAQLSVALARPLYSLALTLFGLLGPPAAAAGAALWGVFVRQSPEALALEAAGGVALITVAALEAQFGIIRWCIGIVRGVFRGVAKWYRGVWRGVQEKSRLAGVLLSHVVFVVPVVVLCAWARGSVGAFVRQYGLYIVSCFMPGWRTVKALYRMEEGEESAADHHGRNLDAWSNGERRNVSDDANSINGDRDGEDISKGSPGVGRDAEVATTIVTRQATPQSSSGGRRRKTNGSTPPATSAPQKSKAAKSAVTPVALKSRSAERASREHEAKLLRFWCVFGVIWAARSAARYFTPALFEAVLGRLDTFLFFFLIWLQIRLTRGADVLFPLLATALRQSRYLRANASTGAEHLNIFLRVLVSVGAVPPERAALIASTLTESGVVLVGIVFFITPRPVTFVGTLLTGYIVPVYISVYSATPASLPAARQTWLSYWVAFAAVESLYSYLSGNFDWMPLWYHFKLALILWLQVPYYRGASSILDAGMEHYGRLVSKYRRTVVTPRKRRIA